jgi:hypothetical protein
MIRLTTVRAFGSIAAWLVLGVMKKKETLNFRVSAEFKRRLVQEAEKERRSLTNYLETTLTKLWDEVGLTVTRGRAKAKAQQKDQPEKT